MLMVDMFTRVKTATELDAMRESGRMLATVLAVVCQRQAPGMSTKELADIAKQELKSLGGTPPFLGYYGFPDVICISVNEQVVHGIPRTDVLLRSGDILSLDFGVSYKGMITDSAVSVFVGEARNKKDKELVSVTAASLQAGIDAVHGGVRVGTIAHAVEQTIRPHKFGIVRELVGHGVGHQLHEDPNIPNYGKADTGPELLSGMTIAIEPMVTLGGHKVMVLDDDWTVVTADGSRAAHFEHTVLITDQGSEIITQL